VAVFKHKCANHEIKINDRDHLPPHCHVFPGNIRVSLHTLEPLSGERAATLPPPLRKCLQEQQQAMLVAWENVELDGTSGRQV
jgi:hypothetical protein